MTPRTASQPREAGGFTLIELMITVMLLSVVVISLVTVMLSASRSKVASANGIEASEAGRIAVDMMSRDLRSAGYGADRQNGTPQQPIAYIDSLQVLINENLLPVGDHYGAPLEPTAYDPALAPNPRPLVGTEWTPPVKYGTGAEIVRWTLDVNNDGGVNAADLLDANSVDAARTPNPNDYELVRMVYGDNGGGGNGGSVQRVALVRHPSMDGVGPMFQVFMKGQTTPWDWSSGPVPAAQLANVERIAVQITAPSGKKDWLGRYAQSTYRTQVNSLRNVPNSSGEFSVSGYVFNDSITVNGIKDAGERGLGGARIQIGYQTTWTSPTGYYSLSVPPGTHWVKQVIVPPLFVNACPTESLSVTIPPATTRDFPDVRAPGAYVTAYVYDDADNDGVQDAGEGPRKGVAVRLRPNGGSPLTTTTLVSGYTPAQVLASPVGACTLSVFPPDSCIVTTANPVVLTITDGVDQTHAFGVCKPAVATVRGKVFRDVNRNGLLEGSEIGVPGVWVGITTDGGMTVPGYATTDADGNYSITVAANDPPRTTPYSIMMVPPDGYYPTTPTSVNGVYLTVGQTLTGKNFGISNFTMIVLQANRVLSLANGDLVEKDWNGNHSENRVQDADVVLGSDTGGTDQISTWFNRYSSTPLYSSTPDYTRSAPGAVMALSLNHLDVNAPIDRPDLVTGCKIAAAGNFFVWWTQNTSGNEGYFPTSYSQAYKTLDMGDVQSVITADLDGGAYPDILVGTKSPTAFTGSIELWTNSNAAVPTFTRTEVYPGAFLPAGSIGEVNTMALGDLDGDGRADLVVGTKRATMGQMYFFKNMGKTASPHFALQTSWGFASTSVTALAVLDVDQDGLLDVVAGTQNSSDLGHLYFLRNGGAFSFSLPRVVNAPGIITSIVAADLGGGLGSDIAIGYHTGTTGYVGGVRIYYLDSGTIPVNGVDPSGGSVTNWVPALTTGNFNYGVNPVANPPFLADLAAGAKISASTGAVVVFIR